MFRISISKSSGTVVTGRATVLSSRPWMFYFFGMREDTTGLVDDNDLDAVHGDLRQAMEFTDDEGAGAQSTRTGLLGLYKRFVVR